MTGKEKRLLDQLGQVRKEGERLKERRAKLIDKAREEGVPVSEIARTLGVSRQAIYKQDG